MAEHLMGEPRFVEWANELRTMRIAELERCIERTSYRLRDPQLPAHMERELREALAAYRETIVRLNGIADAAWWIDRRSVSGERFAAGVARGSVEWRYPPSRAVPQPSHDQANHTEGEN